MKAIKVDRPKQTKPGWFDNTVNTLTTGKKVIFLLMQIIFKNITSLFIISIYIILKIYLIAM